MTVQNVPDGAYKSAIIQAASGGTATAADILSGKTATVDSGLITGAMDPIKQAFGYIGITDSLQNFSVVGLGFRPTRVFINQTAAFLSGGNLLLAISLTGDNGTYYEIFSLTATGNAISSTRRGNPIVMNQDGFSWTNPGLGIQNGTNIGWIAYSK